MKMYLRGKYGWREVVFNSINWKGHKLGIDGLSWNKKITVMNMIHKWLPVNAREKKFDDDGNEVCQGCGVVES